jgi:hypothetical protein
MTAWAPAPPKVRLETEARLIEREEAHAPPLRLAFGLVALDFMLELFF